MSDILISDAERRVMQLLWVDHPQSADDLIKALAPDTGWKSGTIKTLINRLLNKQAISAKKDGRRFLYSPAVSRKSCLQKDSQQFLSRWFDGKLAPLVSHLSETDQLSATEIAELKKLLDDLQDEG